ncbi:hypothetical protein [Dysgonomonas sp. 25]|uniref:hypothetical protein n=1 Tax=Dysgonomonas sp. 25 TaxID=2302933 RepID=UPI0013D1478E|nr:hypothetical protein [Dysgonomonas sp. 25]NDV69289.1 hypothetical protein [Dysgonomonas sp. 25]
MKKIIYTLLFFAALFTLNSCNESKNKDDVIKFYDLENPGKELTNTVILPVVGEGYDIDIQGGSGTYTYGAQDVDIIKVARRTELSGTALRITPLKEGNTSVFVMDSDMNSGRLFISITAYTLKTAVSEDNLEVDVTDPSVKTLIETEMESLRLKMPMAVTFKYKTEKSGTLEVFPDKSDADIKYDGTFEMRTVIGGTFFDMTYNGKMHTYNVTWQNIGNAEGDDVRIVLEADLTDMYQTQYPAAGVQKVIATVRLDQLDN